MAGADVGARALSSNQARTVGLLPGFALASALHLALFALAPGIGGPAAAPEPLPMPVTLVSIPSPEPPPSPPVEPGQSAAEPVAPDIAESERDLPAPTPEPVAETPPEPVPQAPVPDTEPVAAALPEPDQTSSVTPPKLAQARAQHPPASRVVQPAARRQAVLAPVVAAARPAIDAPSQQAAPAHAASSAAAEASFEALLLQAVQAEARRSYPAAARLMGSTGQAVVAFEYRDGSVRVTGLAQTSGSPLLDRAALAAVQNARYPAAPGDFAGRTLVKVVHVKFELSTG